MIPTRFGAIPIDVKSSMPCRYASRRLRLPSAAPCFHVSVAGTYTSRTISAAWLTCSHQVSASPPVYGRDGIRRTGQAPFCARSCTNVRMFCRYCALLSDHGVTSPGPASSFRTMTGFGHPDCVTA